MVKVILRYLVNPICLYKTLSQTGERKQRGGERRGEEGRGRKEEPNPLSPLIFSPVYNMSPLILSV